MQSRREYAVSLGLAKMTRGRLSREAKEAIAKAEAEGKKFSDSPRPNLVSGKVEPKESRPEENIDLFGPTPERIYNRGWYVTEGNKKVSVSGAEVCRVCMVSLDWHRCAHPIIPTWRGEMVDVSR